MLIFLALEIKSIYSGEKICEGHFESNSPSFIMSTHTVKGEFYWYGSRS